MRNVAPPGAISRSVRRATKPATPPSDVQSTGPQGTPGGTASPRRKPGAARQSLKMAPNMYLWALVGIELFVTGVFRKYFRKFHGG